MLRSSPEQAQGKPKASLQQAGECQALAKLILSRVQFCRPKAACKPDPSQVGLHGNHIKYGAITLFLYSAHQVWLGAALVRIRLS